MTAGTLAGYVEGPWLLSTGGENNTSGHIHKFPSVDLHPDRHKKWVNALKKLTRDGTKWIPSKYTVICGDNFITVSKMAASDKKKCGRTDQFEFFWGPESCFSQWYSAEFEVDGVHYNCAEQFMMYQKAVLFNDQETAKAVLEAVEPKKQKSLGRQVKNFDEEIWKSQRLSIVETANISKFSQNPQLKERLLATYPRLLVEASPVDKIWGIGRRADDPKALSKNTWRGENLLGYALTKVRDKLRDQS